MPCPMGQGIFALHYGAEHQLHQHIRYIYKILLHHSHE